MFWNKDKKKKEKKNEKDNMNIRITVIPEIFYGGKDPLIYHEENKKVQQKNQQKELMPSKKPSAPISKKRIIIIAVVVLILFTTGVSYYYLKQSSAEKKNILPVKPLAQVEQKKEVERVVEVVEEPVPEEDIKPVEVEIVETVAQDFDNIITFPNVLLRDSADIDVDSLTDIEEEVFGTDSGIWDSDKDGYYDGQEVFNLYNPKGFAPVRLIDSGLVKEYINPKWQYRVYYPSVWESAGVDTENNHVIFSSITGDFIEVRAFQKLPGDTFATWFSQNIQGQSYLDLSLFNNRYEVDGYKRKDSLVAYFIDNNAVFVMIYQPAGDAIDIPFRHIMQMMYQSFRPSAVFGNIPEQTILPQAP